MKYNYLDHLHMTLHLTDKAFQELAIMLKHRPESQKKLVQSHTMRYYTISLHYLFVNEFCKLFEPVRNKGENVASLYRWIDYMLEEHKNTQSESMLQVFRNRLDEIKEGELFELIKDYRDKKFSHLDGNQKPFDIPMMSFESIQGFGEILESIKNIVDGGCSLMDLQLKYGHTDNRTENFIALHSELMENRR